MIVWLILSVLMLGYTYAGYPLLMAGLARWCGRPVRKGPCRDGVSVLIVAHNEVDTLPTKLESLFELAEEEPIREICLGLDGCSDGTGDRIRELLDRRQLEEKIPVPKVRMLEFQVQRGKTAVLNELMGIAGEGIWVMMDARQRVEKGAVSILLENFADEQVGVVSGALVYEKAEGGAEKGADSYWSYEKNLRLNESCFWAVPGATGALYAIRKELCVPISENTLVDDVLIPMKAVLRGFRCLFEPKARVFDLPTSQFGKENRRKRRTLAGIWQIMRLEPKIYSFLANPIAFQWYSHKFLRLLTPFWVILIVLTAGMMECWTDGALDWPGILFWAMCVGIVASGLAYMAAQRVPSRLLGLLGAFWGVNWALLLALWDTVTARFEPKWK